MELEKRMLGEVTVIALNGNLDSHTGPRVREDLEELLPPGGQVLLDLGRLAYMSSAGLRVLLLVYRHTHRTGARIALAAIPDAVHDVMSATGFLNFFEVTSTVEDGIEALQP